MSIKQTQTKALPADLPVWNAQIFSGLDEAINRKGRPIKFDGTHADYWEYLHRAEDLTKLFWNGTAALVGPDSSVKLGPVVLQQVNTRYMLQSAKKTEFYLADHQVADAIFDTDLTWVDADVFKELPDAFGVILTDPSDHLQIYSNKAWNVASDLLLLRVKDPENRARLCRNLGADEENPETHIFYWIAGSKASLTVGSGAFTASWGAFAVTENMKLEQLADGVEELAKIQGTKALLQEIFVGPTPSLKIPEGLRQQERSLFKTFSEYDRATTTDSMEHNLEQRETGVAIVTFLAKFILLSKCDWFKESAIEVPPLGMKAMPHKARQLRALWSYRYRVVLPRIDAPLDEDSLAERDRKTPDRHVVRGFFRNQAYGPGRTLRKIIWVPPFWRGSIKLGAGATS